MPLALSDFDALLHRVYDSALVPERWPATLGAVAETFDVRGVALWTFTHGVHEGGICYTHALDQAVLEAWATIAPTEDPIVRAAVARGMVVDGAAFKDSDLVGPDWRTRPGPVREVCARLGIGHAGVGVVFSGTDGRQLPVAISLYRPPEDRPFDDAEIDLLRRLVPHLSRSLGVMFHLRDERHRVAASRAALDRLGAGVVLLDAAGNVEFGNAVARAMLDEGRWLRWADDRHPSGSPGLARDPCSIASATGTGVGARRRLALADGTRAGEAAFARALAAATRPYVGPPPAADADDEHFAEAVVLPDDRGRPAVVVHAAPLGARPGIAGLPASVRAIVFLHALEGHARVHPESLIQVFGLTAAEARAAIQLLGGGSLPEMADRLGVSLNTFKTQLKAAYAKTRTTRQAGLLRVMLALAGH